MSKNSRYYTAGTVEALFMLSRGHCYEPSCRTRVMRHEGGSWSIKVEIAHIKGLNEGSARFDASIPVPERNHFRNLILLCKTHHDLVDETATRDQYPESLLLQWKANVEGSHADDLDELDWLTEAKLESLMANAIATTRNSVFNAIDKVKDVTSETLDLLKGLVAESFNRPYMDQATVASLEYSAQVFEQLPAHVELLAESSEGLRHIPYTSEMLFESSRGLREVPHYVELLHHASQNLSSIPEYVESLAASSLRLEDFQQFVHGLSASAEMLTAMKESIGTLGAVSSRIDASRLESTAQDFRQVSSDTERLREAALGIVNLGSTIVALESAAENIAMAATAVGPRGSWSWSSFRWGMFACFLAIAAILALYALGSH